MSLRQGLLLVLIILVIAIAATQIKNGDITSNKTPPPPPELNNENTGNINENNTGNENNNGGNEINQINGDNGNINQGNGDVNMNQGNGDENINQGNVNMNQGNDNNVNINQGNVNMNQGNGDENINQGNNIILATALDSFDIHNNISCAIPSTAASWTVNAVSTEQCAQNCLDDTSCIGFEYDVDSGRCDITHTCSLPRASTHPGVDLYTRNDIALNNFTGTAESQCSGRNELGLWQNGVFSLSDCADKCYGDPTCVSFEYSDTGYCTNSTSCTPELYTTTSANTTYNRNETPLDNFTLLGRNQCSGRNELGLWPDNAYTLTQCADKCYDDPTCVSFEYSDTGYCANSTSCTSEIATPATTNRLFIRNQ